MKFLYIESIQFDLLNNVLIGINSLNSLINKTFSSKNINNILLNYKNTNLNLLCKEDINT